MVALEQGAEEEAHEMTGPEEAEALVEAPAEPASSQAEAPSQQKGHAQVCVQVYRL